jgi:hypothetical protein
MSEHEIGERLTKLEVQVVEKWLAHDKRSDERWADLMEKFHELAKKFNTTPCSEHIKVMLELNHRLKAIESWQNTINWAIGVVYVALITAIVKVIV